MSLHSFKLLPVAGAVAFLAACGGGDDAPANNVGWASPAYIVPAGAASKSIALTGCTGTTTLQSATLVVTSAGDMIFSGAPDGTTTVSVLNRVNYASATYRYVQGTNSESGPSAFVQQSIEQGEDSDYMYAGTSGAFFYSSKDSSPSHSINCGLASGTTSFALTSVPSSARVASLMTSGVTSIDTSSQGGASATFASGVATWDSIGSGTSPYRYVQFNVNTGALATSATATGTFAATTINFPTTATSTSAYFSEELNRDGSKRFYASVQQTLGEFRVSLGRVGNALSLWWD